jgi:transcriptional regulator with XRE-family HTH domain
MDDLRFGNVVRRLRIRLGWRQRDLADRCGVSTSTISRIERGHLDTLSLATLRKVAAVLEIRLDLLARWRGGDLDRLLNARHSALHEQVASAFLRQPGWHFEPEVSFAVYADRGVIDILAFHPDRAALLVIELKTDIVDVNELVGTIHRKRRHARQIAAEQGWAIGPAVTVSAWVIVAPGRTNRRRVQGHASMLRAAFPMDGRGIDGWLANPDRPMRCLSFWPDSPGRTVGPGPVPVRRVAARRRLAS